MSLPNPLYTPFIDHDMGMIAIYTLRRHHTSLDFKWQYNKINYESIVN